MAEIINNNQTFSHKQILSDSKKFLIGKLSLMTSIFISFVFICMITYAVFYQTSIVPIPNTKTWYGLYWMSFPSLDNSTISQGLTIFGIFAIVFFIISLCFASSGIIIFWKKDRKNFLVVTTSVTTFFFLLVFIPAIVSSPKNLTFHDGDMQINNFIHLLPSSSTMTYNTDLTTFGKVFAVFYAFAIATPVGCFVYRAYKLFKQA